MSADKYVAFDVHKASIYAVVRDHRGQIVCESILKTLAEPVLDFLRGLGGRVWLTFEEGAQATWLYDLTDPIVDRVIVCNPRKNRSGPKEPKSDRIDARRLSEWLFLGTLKPVFHETSSVRRLKHLVRAYTQLVGDRARMKNRFRANFTANAIESPGPLLYAPTRRETWLAKLPKDGTRHRAEVMGRAIDALTPIIVDSRRALVAEVSRHPDYPIIDSLPGFGPVRSAILIGTIVTPYRFRRNRQLWTYAGLSVVMHTSSDHVIDAQGVRRQTTTSRTRGLTANYNRPLKDAFKGAASRAVRIEPFKQVFEHLIARGLSDSIARVVIARKLASCALAIWKKGEHFDADRLMPNQVTR